MKASELRIGNCIKYSNFEGIKKELRGSYVIVDGDVLRFLSNFKTELGVELWYLPIELTEEILLKCGFEKDTFLNYLYHHSEGITLWFRNGEFVCNKNLIQIKYLHKLQNFFFLLKEKELEINL